MSQTCEVSPKISFCLNLENKFEVKLQEVLSVSKVGVQLLKSLSESSFIISGETFKTSGKKFKTSFFQVKVFVFKVKIFLLGETFLLRVK